MEVRLGCFDVSKCVRERRRLSERLTLTSELYASSCAVPRLLSPCTEHGFVLNRPPQARSNTEFGNGWVVNVDECDDVDPGPTDPCEDGPEGSRQAAEDVCYILKDVDGR